MIKTFARRGICVPVDGSDRNYLGDPRQQGRDAGLVCTLGARAQHAADDNITDCLDDIQCLIASVRRASDFHWRGVSQRLFYIAIRYGVGSWRLGIARSDFAPAVLAAACAGFSCFFCVAGKFRNEADRMAGQHICFGKREDGSRST